MALSLFLKHASERELGYLAAQTDALLQTRSRRQPRADVLDLAESWHVLHGLFTGSAWDGSRPANTLLTGGHEVGLDLGCGRPRLATALETRAFAQYIAPLCPYRLKSTVDRKRVARTRFYMAEDGLCPDLSELHERVIRDLPALKTYVARAAQHGHGLLLWMR